MYNEELNCKFQNRMEFATLLIGIILIFVFFYTARKTLKLLKYGIRTDSEIVAVERRESTSTDEDGYNSTSVTYVPILRYTHQNGETLQFTASVGVGSKNKYKVGQNLEIIYDPTSTKNPLVNSFTQLWLFKILILLTGILLTVTGLATVGAA